jgi:hypothetical protein
MAWWLADVDDRLFPPREGSAAVREKQRRNVTGLGVVVTLAGCIVVIVATRRTRVVTR